MATSDDFRRLTAPFDPARVSWRVGSTNKDKTRGMALAYIDARDVMDRLDDVCGPEGWQCRYPHAEGKTVCEIGIRVNDEWVWKADGAGDTDVEAEKGALSDAFKRAAVRWGIGRYLYDIASPWVTIEPHGRSYTIADSEKLRLAKLLPTAAASASGPRLAPPPAEPDNAALDEQAMVSDLVEQMQRVSTVVALDALRKDADFVSTVRRLSKEGLNSITIAGRERRAQLEARMKSGALGDKLAESVREARSASDNVLMAG